MVPFAIAAPLLRRIADLVYFRVFPFRLPQRDQVFDFFLFPPSASGFGLISQSKAVSFGPMSLESTLLFVSPPHCFFSFLP